MWSWESGGFSSNYYSCCMRRRRTQWHSKVRRREKAVGVWVAFLKILLKTASSYNAAQPKQCIWATPLRVHCQVRQMNAWVTAHQNNRLWCERHVTSCNETFLMQVLSKQKNVNGAYLTSLCRSFLKPPLVSSHLLPSSCTPAPASMPLYTLSMHWFSLPLCYKYSIDLGWDQ